MCTMRHTKVHEAHNEKNSIFYIAIGYFIQCIRK